MRISATLSAFIVKTLEVSGPSNLNLMTTFASPISTSFVFPRHGPTTCVMITVYFLIDKSLIDVTGYTITRLVVVVFWQSFLPAWALLCSALLCSECVWVEIPAVDGINLLVGNHYFSPDTKLEVISEYFCLIENLLDTNNFCVIILGDFNAPGFIWERGSPLPLLFWT
jgi:hypothetical protein